MKKSGRVTIYDVAKDADVSFAAVSKVVREASGVSDAMRAKVHASIDKLGYRPHTAARGMRGKTFLIALMLPDIRNPFFESIVAGIHEAIDDTQYRLLIATNRTKEGFDIALVHSMIDMQVDGVIVVGAVKDNHLLEIAKRRPLVTIGNHASETAPYDTVNNDDREGARLAARHLIEQGYEKVAMFSLSNGLTNIAQRELGYREEMTRHGLERYIRILHATPVISDIRKVGRGMLEGPDRPEAVFCWTDYISFELISISRQVGLCIPNDLAIVGYDNVANCQLDQNDTSSIDQAGEVLGREAAKSLIARFKGNSGPVRFVLQPKLVQRGSSARLIR